MKKYTLEIDGVKKEVFSEVDVEIDFLLNKFEKEIAEKFYKDGLEDYKFSIEEPLKIWYISTYVYGWDTYDSAVVNAYNKEEALEIFIARAGEDYRDSKVTYLGICTKENDKSRIVCASFNAG